MKRILFIAMNLNSGGAERQMVSIASFLKDVGHDVAFVCYEEGNFFLDQLEERGIDVTWILKKKAISRLFAFRRFIRKGDYDVVISFLETANILNLFASIGGKRWIIITGERSSKIENLTSLRGRLVALMQYRSDAMVCNSWNALNMWQSHYPKLSKKMRVIYNGVSVNQCDSMRRETDGIIKILIAASYRNEKNPMNLINAVGEMKEKDCSRLRIDWYGAFEFPGSVYKICLARINELRLTNIIHLNGPTKDINKLMCQSDYVALFSKFEGLPNAICEAMMLGKPVIMTKVSDYSAIVLDNGFICEGDDSSCIREVIEKAISTPVDKRNSMGEKSKQMAEALFSRHSSNLKWQQLIDEL